MPNAETKTPLVPRRDVAKGKIFSPIRQDWFVEFPEELVRQQFVCTLVNEYGFSLDQMGEELETQHGREAVEAASLILLAEAWPALCAGRFGKVRESPAPPARGRARRRRGVGRQRSFPVEPESGCRRGRFHLFVANGGQVRWQRRIDVPPVVIRPALDGGLEQPIGDAFARAAELRDAAQQPGNMRNLAQLVGERRCERLFVQFHDRQYTTDDSC